MPEGSLPKPGTAQITRNDTDAIPEVDVTIDMVADTQNDPESWLLYGGGYRNQRHMVDSRITTDNVGDLTREWEMNVGVTPGEYQGSPLIVPGDPPIMYQTNGPDHLRAINARTGDVLWHYDYQPKATIGDPPANRGVTIIGDTVYFTQLDLGMVALDRFTAEEKWYFNQAKEYIDEEVDDPETEIHPVTNFARNVGFTSGIPPIPWEGNLLKGSFGGEYGVSGWIDAVSTDGEHQWRFNTTPPDQWVGDSWRHGSTTVWQPPALDPDTGTAVFPTGNPGPDFDATVRPSWNQYSCGKLALDAETGEYEWHFQESPHDWWDYDSPAPPFIFEAEARGEQRTMVSWPGKSGWLFTFDVETGEMIQRSEEYCMHHNMWALPEQGDHDATPWTAPNILGGTDPQPPAYDPTSRTAVVKGDNRPMKLSWKDADFEAGKLYWALNELTIAQPGDVDIPEWNEKPGVIAGIDPVTGAVKWRHDTDITQWGSAMTTDTGITFAGSSSGQFLALDTETGEQLWSDDLGVGVGGDPVSWYDPGEGKQYVVIQGGGEGPLGGYGTAGDKLVVYSVEASMDDSTETSTEEATDTPTEAPTDSPTDEPTDSPTEASGGDDATATAVDSPGLGVLSALAGVGSAAAGYALSRDDEDDEE